jgi:hypothetical protein
VHSADDREPSSNVGYCRPPAEHRFKPGRSGNPKGRPKGSRNIASIVADVLARRIRTKIDGETQRILPTEALVHVVLRKALNGDRHAWETVFRWIEQAEASKERRDAVRSFGEKEEAILQRMQERFANAGEQ